MRQLLDTNVLLRFLVGDVPSQQAQAEKWFKEAKLGKRSIALTPLVVAEACFVLETFYKKQRQEIANALEIFIAQPWLEVPERGTLLGLWQWYREGKHFVDSWLFAAAATDDTTGILTFDRELQIKARRGK